MLHSDERATVEFAFFRVVWALGERLRWHCNNPLTIHKLHPMRIVPVPHNLGPAKNVLDLPHLLS